MDHTSRTGCYYTTVGNYHDLSSRPHIAIEPIKGCHPKGIVPDSIAVERVVLERAVQAEIDEINESRRKNDWLGSHYVWNSREKAWTRRPLYNGPTPMPRKIFKDKGAHLQKYGGFAPTSTLCTTAESIEMGTDCIILQMPRQSIPAVIQPKPMVIGHCTTTTGQTKTSVGWKVNNINIHIIIATISKELLKKNGFRLRR
ncbi:hypothetical protein PG995_001679 [Apiospora arundinis]